MNAVIGTRAPLAGSHPLAPRPVNRTGKLPLPPFFCPVENNHRNRDVAHRRAPLGPDPARDPRTIGQNAKAAHHDTGAEPRRAPGTLPNPWRQGSVLALLDLAPPADGPDDFDLAPSHTHQLVVYLADHALVLGEDRENSLNNTVAGDRIGSLSPSARAVHARCSSARAMITVTTGTSTRSEAASVRRGLRRFSCAETGQGSALCRWLRRTHSARSAFLYGSEPEITMG